MPRTEQDLGQPSTRRKGKFTDTNHGRRWFAEVDKRSGGTVGKIQPLGWRAPWSPDPQYFRFDEEDPTKFTIDYAGMLNDRLAAHEAWNAEIRDAALKRGWDPADETKLNNLISIIGPKPLPIEPIVAAMQGNSWILGLSQKVDERVERFLPKKVNRVEKAVQSMDFRDESEPDTESEEHFEQRMDLEEQHDEAAVGGKRAPVSRKPKAKDKAA